MTLRILLSFPTRKRYDICEKSMIDTLLLIVKTIQLFLLFTDDVGVVYMFLNNGDYYSLPYSLKILVLTDYVGNTLRILIPLHSFLFYIPVFHCRYVKPILINNDKMISLNRRIKTQFSIYRMNFSVFQTTFRRSQLLLSTYI